MADNKNLSSYLFTVEIDRIETARFQKCEGLEAETYVYEIEKGGLNTTTHKFYGRTRYPNLILEKGISDNDEILIEGFDKQLFQVNSKGSFEVYNLE